MAACVRPASPFFDTLLLSLHNVYESSTAAAPDRSALLEQRLQQLEQQLSEANGHLTKLQQQHEQLQGEADKRVAAVKQVRLVHNLLAQISCGSCGMF